MATREKPVDVAAIPDASGISDLAALDAAVADCRCCDRLVAWRERVATEKRASYADQVYWGRAVPGFGPGAGSGVAGSGAVGSGVAGSGWRGPVSLLVVGLAPAAHGANRTGRMFTGDRSGDVLYAALHAVGLANQPTSVHIGDGLALRGTRITAPVHCAPPDNKPTPAERDTCRPWFDRELELLAPSLKVVVVLGGFGWQALFPVLAGAGWTVPRPRPVFRHGAHIELMPARAGREPLHVFGSYHVSQQNTFTGRLTPAMLEDVLGAAARAAGLR